MENQFEISDLEFIPISRSEGGLLGFVSFKIGNEFSVQSIAVHSLLNPSSGKKIRLVWAGKRIGSKFLFYFKPLNPEIEEEVRRLVEQKLEEIVFFKV